MTYICISTVEAIFYTKKKSRNFRTQPIVQINWKSTSIRSHLLNKLIGMAIATEPKQPRPSVYSL